MHAALKKSFQLLVVATLAVVAIGVVTFRDLARDVFPRATGLVPLRKADWPPAWKSPDKRIELDAKTGLVVTYDRFVMKRRSPIDVEHGHFEGTRITTLACANLDASSPTILERRRDCALSEIPIDLPDGQSPSDVHVYRSGANPAAFVVRVVDPLTYSVEPVVAVFERVETPVRRFLPSRIVSTRHVPALVVVFAFGALAFGLHRARRGAAYARTMSTWSEATLSADGMLQDEVGATIGTLASGRRRVPAGTVLVAPNALAQGSVYRELPIVDRGNIAAGSHATWTAATAFRLRDAKSLAVIATVTALCGLGARFLGA